MTASTSTRGGRRKARAPIGFHLSIAGGFAASVDRAADFGCDAFQIFPGNPRGWAHNMVSPDDAALFRDRRRAVGIRCVVVHTAYLINLATPVDAAFRKSIALFNDELRCAEALGADYLVTHLGSPLKADKAFAAERVCEALGEAARLGLGKKTMILLENTSGSGTGFGADLGAIGSIIKETRSVGQQTGLCFDTCHAFAAGYPLCQEADGTALVETINREAGLDNLKLIHLNDSKGAPGSRIDRHEHIGAGRIDLAALSTFIRHPAIRKIPLILETPKKTGRDDRRNYAAVLELLGAKA